MGGSELTGEIDVFGLFLPELLIYAIVALVAQALVSRVFAKLDLHRLFWHPPLIEISIFVICLGGVAATAHWVLL